MSSADARGRNAGRHALDLIAAGRFAEAHSPCAQWCKACPSDPQAWLMKGYSELQLGRASDAAESLRRAVNLQPANVEFRNTLGFALYRAGRHADAEAQYREALRLRPDYAEAWNHMGNAVMQLERTDEAVHCYREALRIEPRFADAHCNLGNALKAAGDVEGAMRAYRNALEYDPGHYLAYYNMGNAQLLRGDAEAAATAYRKALAIAPQYLDARFQLANVLKAQGKLEEALDAYRKVVAADPANVEAWFRMGVINGQLDRFDRAIYCYGQALESRPDFSEARSNLGGVLNTVGRHEEALTQFRRALEDKPDNAQALFNMGNAYRAMDRAEEATRCYEQTLRIKSDFPEAAYHLAVLRGLPPPEKPPADYVASLFDQYAWRFDQHLVQGLQYRTPELLNEAVRRVLPGAPASLDILDLGCGTGLFGYLVRDLARTLTGVDLSAKMIEKAREKGVYDALHVGDIVELLGAGNGGYDLIVAADVLPYFGSLEVMFDACSANARPESIFAFSAESAADAGEYVVRPSGRYAHAAAYLRAAGERAQFEVLSMDEVVLRKEKDVPVRGYVFVMRRRG